MIRCTSKYQVDSSGSDVVMYWTVKGTHVVPDIQQYDGHTPITSCKTPSRQDDVRLHHTHHADMIPGASNRSFNEYSSTSSTPSVRADYLF